MRLSKVLLTTALLLTCTPWTSAQATGRIETRTRLVSQFSGLQTQWMDAIRKKDGAALDHLLSDDFEVWTPAHSGPIPREDWQAQAFAENLKSFRLADMAVKSPREDIAIESLRLETTTSAHGQDVRQQFFVVNLWIREKNHWLCTDSYVSSVGSLPAPTPVRPTGKD